MGFLDKAKQMAKDLDVEKAKQMAKQATEQAQAKIDEVQGNFNQSQQGGAAPAGQGPATEYDKHGRPVTASGDAPAPPAPPAPAAGETPAPPAPDVPAGDAPQPPPPAAAAPKPPAPPSEAPAPPKGDDGPKPMTSGDPLAG